MMLAARQPAPAAGPVLDLMQARIARALRSRSRYRYVQPRVLPAGRGWQISSPNCSRNVRADGGEILIAWLQPAAGGLWRLSARDHAAQRWVRKLGPVALADALEHLCRDPAREFWQ